MRRKNNVHSLSSSWLECDVVSHRDAKEAAIPMLLINPNKQATAVLQSDSEGVF